MEVLKYQSQFRKYWGATTPGNAEREPMTLGIELRVSHV